MPSNFTEHYQLSQWEAADQVLREDFNADNAKIDAALGDKLRLVVGSYLGTGRYGPGSPTVIEAPDAECPPRLIIVTEDNNHRRAILIRGTTQSSVLDGSVPYPLTVTWTDKGVRFYSTQGSYQQLNHVGSDGIYHYHYAVFI